MVFRIAFLFVFSWLALPGHSNAQTRPDKLKKISIKDLQEPLTRERAITLLGKKNMLDSNASIEPDQSILWHEHALDSIRKREHKKKCSFSQMSFGNIFFEGSLTKVTILFADDIAFGSIVALPYPLRFGSMATQDEFDRLCRNIATTIGDATVSTLNYIDYIRNGQQSVFGEFRDGKIVVKIWNVKN